jgi:predicted DNA-binding protein
MKARTQIRMPTELRRRARIKAAKLGISLADYLRRIIAADLRDWKPRRRNIVRRLRRRIRSK